MCVHEWGEGKGGEGGRGRGEEGKGAGGEGRVNSLAQFKEVYVCVENELIKH